MIWQQKLLNYSRTVLPASPRAWITLCHDLGMAGLSFLIALWLRVGPIYEHIDINRLITATFLSILIGGGCFFLMRLYRGLWRYASIRDMMAILRAVTIMIPVLTFVLFIAVRLEDVPRSTMIIQWFVLVAALGGPRFIYRALRDRGLFHSELQTDSPDRIPVILIGVGNRSEAFIREMQRDPQSEYRVIGLLAEQKSEVGRHIHGVSVLGSLNNLSSMLDHRLQSDHPPRRLVVSSEKISPEDMRDIVKVADQYNIPVSRLPRSIELQQEKGAPTKLRPIAIEDLLGRPQTHLDLAGMLKLIQGRRILVTGAGGSIGSELVRRIAERQPAELALVDHSEFSLYRIETEMQENFQHIPYHAYLGDVRDKQKMAHLFSTTQPELVFHAAAYKHVPIVEANPAEGVATNVIGTQNISDLCREFKVSTMVLISTDKAINPTNVMGATKRIAEMYCQAQDVCAAAEDSTRFVTVRFGNVLGSTGSVVPLFQRQLEQGGPLTVTHPDITRYFMTIREAVELVLQAATLGSRTVQGEDARHLREDLRGKIMVLDMGKPVKIVDLAEQMIRLAGLEPGNDISIKFTGLRPGEKLYEELFHDQEELHPSPVTGIFIGQPRLTDLSDLQLILKQMKSDIQVMQTTALLTQIQKLVPEFQSQQMAPK